MTVTKFSKSSSNDDFICIIWSVTERTLETKTLVNCGHVATTLHLVLTGNMMLSLLHRQRLSTSPEILSERDVFLSFVLITYA